MNHSKKQKQEPNLAVIVSNAVDQRVEMAVASKLASMQEEVIAKVIARLEAPTPQQNSSFAQPGSTHKFFDGLAGP